MTDRQTDRRTGKNNMSPDPVGGRHKNQTDAFKRYMLWWPYVGFYFVFKSFYKNAINSRASYLHLLVT